MKFTLLSVERIGVIHTATEGSLTASDIEPSGKNPLETLLGITWNTNRVLMNFAKTGYMDSCAIGWLIGTNRAFRDGGGKLVIYGVQPAVRQIMDVLKIGKAVSIVDSDEAGRKLLVDAVAK